MIYSTKQLIKKYGNQRKIDNLINSNLLFKISYGVYSDVENESADLERIFIRYPNSTLTNESAFCYYNLTDYIPEKYIISTTINARKVNLSFVKQVYMDEKMQKIGRVKIKTQSGYIFIYDKERMLIELFRLQTKFAPEIFNEVVKNYRNMITNNELDLYKVSSYLKKITYGRNILKRISECVL